MRSARRTSGVVNTSISRSSDRQAHWIGPLLAREAIARRPAADSSAHSRELVITNDAARSGRAEDLVDGHLDAGRLARAQSQTIWRNDTRSLVENPLQTLQCRADSLGSRVFLAKAD